MKHTTLLVALLGPAALVSAQSCPTLRVGIKGPGKATNNHIYEVRVAVKNAGTLAAANSALTVELPDNVLYLSQSSKIKGGDTRGSAFARNGQDLTWTGITFSKRGAGLVLRLKVNVTNCADGKLEFNARTSVGGLCPATANPSYTDVKHPPGWVACPP